jgi:predicted nucleic acid-binding protein
MLLDTSILVELLRGNAEIKEKVKVMERERETFRASAASAFELYYGAYTSSRAEENIKLIKDLLKSLELISYNEMMAEILGEILARLRKEEKMIDLRDLFISATAIGLGERLSTMNLRHYGRVWGLRVEIL